MKIMECVSKSVNNSHEYLKKAHNPTIKLWLETFCAEMAVPVSELEHVLRCDLKDFTHLKQLVEGKLNRVMDNVLTFCQNVTSDTIKWTNKTPYQEIAERLQGCEAECPFCREPCQFTDPNHSVPHQCILHRPKGISGIYSLESDKLSPYSCNFSVQKKNKYFRCSACRYECVESGKCDGIRTGQNSHLYREYKNFLPHWNIAPSANMESSTYWMWFMATYQEDLEDLYSTEPSDIPPEWKEITIEEAKESLHKF
jgi:hypothetical protein